MKKWFTKKTTGWICFIALLSLLITAAIDYFDNLDVKTNIAVGGTVDGVDVAALKIQSDSNATIVALKAYTADVLQNNLTSIAQGHILYYSGSTWVNLPPDTSGKYLKTQGAGANPAWDTPIAGGSGTDTTAIHDNVDGEINAIATKATPVNADMLLIEDSAASFAKKKIPWSSLPGAASGEANTASNGGAGGVGITLTKSGVDLPFKSINTGSTKVTVTNDAVNYEVDVDVDSGKILDAEVSGNGIIARTTTETYTNRTITGTADEITVTNGDGVAGNPTISLPDNPILSGTGSLTIPKGTTAERPGSPVEGMTRYNTTLNAHEYYDGSDWTSGSYSYISLGASNSVVGQGAGTALVGGIQNSLLGVNSGTALVGGSYNTAHGYHSLYSNISGNKNTAIGNLAGYGTTGSDSVFLGYKAGYNYVATDEVLFIDNQERTTPYTQALIAGYFDVDPTQQALNLNASVYARYGLSTGGDLTLNSTQSVDTIEISLTDDDTHLPSSGAVVDALASKVTGPASATDNVFVRFDGTTGKLVQNGTLIEDDNGDVYTVGTTDYFSSSTITGWSGTPTGYIYYRKLGKQVTIWFYINGTSDQTYARFTLPYTNNSNATALGTLGYAIDAGTGQTGATKYELGTSSNLVNCYTNMTSGAWTNSATKVVRGWFVYFTD